MTVTRDARSPFTGRSLSPSTRPAAGPVAELPPPPAGSGPGGRRPRRVAVGAGLAVVALAAVAFTGWVSPGWADRSPSSAGSSSGAPSDGSGPTSAAPTGSPTRQAEDWIATNVTDDRTQYAVAAAGSTDAGADRSITVAAFGDGADRVEVHRLVTRGAAALAAAQEAARSTRLQAGASLAANASLQISPDAVDQIRTGQVDERLLNVLATLAAQHDLEVAAFPAVAGEEGVGAPRRTVEIDSIDFHPVVEGSAEVTDLMTFLSRQLPAYRPVSVTVEARSAGNASLRITYAYRDPGALGN